MGYLHINNLSKDGRILQLFKRVYACEKVHGTSAHVRFAGGKIYFFSGGEKHETFVNIFNAADLQKGFEWAFPEPPTKVVVYGEAYGGKMQGMSGTYGTRARFIAFDMAINDRWLQVEHAKHLAESLGLEFVAFNLVECTQEALDHERDIPSRIGVLNAQRDGVVDYVPKPAEGVVIRPTIELDYRPGDRIIAKHKRSDFSERKSKSDTNLNPDKALELATAEAVAEEFVTEMRLSHVVDHLKGDLGRELTFADIPEVIDAMMEDVLREGAGEVENTKPNRKAIGNATAKMLKMRTP